MNLSEIRDLVRAEGNIEGLREHQTLIDNVINQELQRFTGKAKYSELRTNFTYNLIADAEYQLSLPADFQLFDALLYYRSDDLEKGLELSKGNLHGYERGQNGHPIYFTRYGLNKIYIYPATDTLIGDRLVLSYFKKPEMLLDTDSLPVPSLEAAVQQAVMGRILRMTDTRKAQLATQESKQAFFDSRAADASF